MSKPKIVIFDLETLPDPRAIYQRIPSIDAWPGRTFKADIQTIMCFGYKFLGKKKTYCANGWDYPGWNKDRHDDSALVHFIYEMLKDVDGVITHNGKRFDMKVVNTRLAYHGLPRLPDIPHMDTKILAKRNLSLYSNSLAAVAKFFGVDDKMTFGNKWSYWERMAFCEESKKDRTVMDKYCKQDVDTLEQIFKKLMQYCRSMPNYNMFTNDPVNSQLCAVCGSSKIHKHGFKKTKTTRYPRYQCQDCAYVGQANKKGKNLK